MIASSDSLAAEGTIDLRAAAARLWASRWWILASVLLFTAVAAAYAFLTTPVYRATAVLVAASDRGAGGQLSSSLSQLGGLAALAGVNLNSSGGAEIEEALAVLRSRELTEGFIRSENLMPKLFRSKWDEQAKKWKGATKDWPTYAEGFKYFDSKLRKIEHDKKTGLVTLQIDWRDPQEAAAWANGLVERLNTEMRSRAVTSSTASIAYLEKELAATSTVDTRQAINRLMESQINKRMLANVTEQYSLRVVDRAMPADVKDMVVPKKGMTLVLGPILGLGFGAMFVLILGGLIGETAAPRPDAASR